MRGLRQMLSWVLAIFLVVMFLMLADTKLLVDASGENVIFATIAERSGIPLFEPTGRYAVGVAEAVTALLIALPFTRRFGAFLAFCITAAAVGFHVSPWLGVEAPTAIGGADTDGGELFNLALALLAASVLLVFVHPKSGR
ncbi:MAG: hypothetical protein AAF719_07520 [Pseudomonadota bacterium]